MQIIDPLKIYYFLVMDDDTEEDMSPFHGFGSSWTDLHWAMQLINLLPVDVAERSHKPEDIAPQRIAGLRPLLWQPLSAASLEKTPLNFLPPCTVVLTGNKNVGKRVDAWIQTYGSNILHFPQDQIAQLPLSEITEILSKFCFCRLLEIQESLSEEKKVLIDKLNRDWKHPMVELEHVTIKSHNVSIPNYMSLQRVGYNLPEGDAFVGANEQVYTDLIMESAGFIRYLRQKMRLHNGSLPELGAANLILFEPALFRDVYKSRRPKSPEELDIKKAMHRFQKQRGFHNSISEEEMERMTSSPAAFMVAGIRAEELRTQTLGVGLYAAAQISPVLRLSPSVNHVFDKLSSYARSLRSARPEAKRKSARLLGEIQERLASALGPERLDAILKTHGPVKIISDAPIEWLSINGIPLSFVKNCSRIPVTPGNIMMGQLIPYLPITLKPEAIREILVITSFTDDDPLKFCIRNVLRTMEHLWVDRLEIKQVFVSSIKDFEDALNAFTGSILVFDGHGISNDTDPIGAILIGREKLDVWSLRKRVKCPPIVILSACDTHGVDASTHATVANGFLALGAVSVLGTFLPVGGMASAVFVSRLMYRVSEYIPAMVKATKKPISWLEVISGMLKMSLAMEVMSDICKKNFLRSVREQANHDINARREDWFERMIVNISAATDSDPKVVRKKALASISISDAVRYTQLGNPERICFYE